MFLSEYISESGSTHYMRIIVNHQSLTIKQSLVVFTMTYIYNICIYLSELHNYKIQLVSINESLGNNTSFFNLSVL